MLIQLLILFNLSFAYLYYEIIFNMTTTASMTPRSFMLTCIYALSYGIIGGILSSLPKRYGLRYVLRALFILPVLVCFTIEEYVFLEFKTLYEPITILSGGGDAARTYNDTILSLVTSKYGLLCLMLLMLPVIVLVMQSIILRPGKHTEVTRPSLKARLTTVGIAATCLLASTLYIRTTPFLRQMHSNRYTFSNSVKTFGLMDSIRSEIMLRLKKKEVTFATVDESKLVATPISSGNTEVATKKEEPAITTKTPTKEYNSLDIDFAALAKTDSKPYSTIDEYVSTLTPSKTNDYTGLFAGKNLIFITAEAFSGFIIDEELTPTLYRLANKGMQIDNYYQPCTAGTTGGECANLLGLTPMLGGDSVKVTADNNNYFTMGAALSREGYYGRAYHNNDYTYYDRDQTHTNLGYSDGFLGMGNGMESFVDNTWPQSDYQMFVGTMEDYIDKEHFNVYYMTVSGHGDYTAGSSYISAKNYERTASLPYSDNIKRYIAANLELEDALTYMVAKLEEKGIADDTVIVISADHYPYALDDNAVPGQLPLLSELYGYEVTNYIMREKNRLIIWSGSLEESAPIVVKKPVNSIDLLPTLLNLFGLSWDSRLLPGIDIFSDSIPVVYSKDRDWISEYGIYLASTGNFTQTDLSVTLPADYVKNMNALVDNRLSYSEAVLSYDYFGHLVKMGVLKEDE